MSTASTTSSRRRHVAAEALDRLGAGRGDHQVLSVQCSRSHHLAAVYDTDAGPVYVAVTGPHAHGARDRVDTAHHGGSRGTEHVDLLQPTGRGRQTLPAWCDCGPRTLVRTELLDALRDRVRTLHLP